MLPFLFSETLRNCFTVEVQKANSATSNCC